MLPQRIANIVFLLLVLGACGYFGWIAKDFEAQGFGSSTPIGPEIFPLVSLGLMALSALIVGYQYLTKGEVGDDGEEQVFESGGTMIRGVLMMAVAVSCYVIWRNFGFEIVAVAIGPLSLIAMGIRNPLYYIILLALSGLTYLAFTRLLNVQL